MSGGIFNYNDWPIFRLTKTGIEKLHKNSETPKKKTKKRPLTKEENANNRRINSERVKLEHTNCPLKRFHFIADTYSNPLKRFAL
jgi:hypothetical protein